MYSANWTHQSINCPTFPMKHILGLSVLNPTPAILSVKMRKVSSLSLFKRTFVVILGLNGFASIYLLCNFSRFLANFAICRTLHDVSYLPSSRNNSCEVCSDAYFNPLFLIALNCTDYRVTLVRVESEKKKKFVSLRVCPGAIRAIWWPFDCAQLYG